MIHWQGERTLFHTTLDKVIIQRKRRLSTHTAVATKGYVVYSAALVHIDIGTVSSGYIVLMLMNEPLKVNCPVRRQKSVSPFIQQTRRCCATRERFLMSRRFFEQNAFYLHLSFDKVG